MDLLSQILGGVFGGGIVAMLLGTIYKNLNKQVSINTSDIKQVKENYLDRFDNVYKKIDDVQSCVSATNVAVARIETKLEDK